MGRTRSVAGREASVGITCSAVICDVDGTLVDSTPAVERIWRAWSAEHGVDAETVLQSAHGRRSEDTIRDVVAPDLVEPALRRQQELELADLSGITAFAGAARLVSDLATHPRLRWGLATSLPRPLLAARLAAASLPMPDTVITSDLVTRGKPDPECYLLVARELGVPPRTCVVIEDAPAGVQAARAAGATVIAVTHTFEAEALAPHAAFVVASLEQIHATHDGVEVDRT